MPFRDPSYIRWIEVLYELSKALVLDHDTAHAYQRILEHCAKGLDAISGAVAVYDEADDCGVIIAQFGPASTAIGESIPRGHGIIGHVIQSGRPALETMQPVSEDSEISGHQDLGRAAPPGSSICWPLYSGNRLLDLVMLHRGPDQPPFTEGDLTHGTIVSSMIAVVVENTHLHEEQEARIRALSDMNRKLADTQAQLMQSEKMASIGQLAAGVAHEINNPIGFVHSNLGTLEKYVEDLFKVMTACELAGTDQHKREAVELLKKQIDFAYLRDDIPALLRESKDGIRRVKEIVQNLKDFSYADTSPDMQWADLHAGLDSTLNIVWNEIKYKATVTKDYGDIPQIQCRPSELNQVFMNLLVNAAQAITTKGEITIRTSRVEDAVKVEISDTGKGISPEHLSRIFDPFFTTKPMGTGTGLGLALSYGIVRKHRGRIEVGSTPGIGTTFEIWLPIDHSSREQSPT